MPRDALTEIKAFEKQAKGSCKAVDAIEEVLRKEPSLRPGLEAALSADSGLTSTAIAKWFANEGVDISDRTIVRHRSGRCACG